MSQNLPIKFLYTYPILPCEYDLHGRYLEPHYPVVKGKRGIVPPKLMENIKLNDNTRKFLQNYFKPWNEKLFKVIGEEYDWN